MVERVVCGVGGVDSGGRRSAAARTRIYRAGDAGLAAAAHLSWSEINAQMLVARRHRACPTAYMQASRKSTIGKAQAEAKAQTL